MAVARGVDVGSHSSQAAALLLELHGGVVMLFLLLLGAFMPAARRDQLAPQPERRTGLVMMTVNVVLIVTAYGHYHSGSNAV